ncbi:hypothetical protein HQO83_07350 [Rhodococcus fascians]|nr:hypothetical protein [Rhodococcus fascians]
MLNSHSRDTRAPERKRTSHASFDAESPTARVDEYLELAHNWQPFGGVPEEEIFVRFGVSKAQFDDAVLAAGRMDARSTDGRVSPRMSGGRF